MLLKTQDIHPNVHLLYTDVAVHIVFTLQKANILKNLSVIDRLHFQFYIPTNIWTVKRDIYF